VSVYEVNSTGTIEEPAVIQVLCQKQNSHSPLQVIKQRIEARNGRNLLVDSS
jgi:hypothetical protein